MFIRLLIFIFLSFFSFMSFADDNIKDNIIPITESIIDTTSSDKWLSILDDFSVYIRDTIFWILMVIVIWMFIFIWAKLVVARWNQEEFKKAIQSFIYVVVWIAIVSVSWLAVRLITWINL